MYEHSYCQHKALKPADFKLNSAALQGPASSGRPEGPGDEDRACKAWSTLMVHYDGISEGSCTRTCTCNY